MQLLHLRNGGDLFCFCFWNKTGDLIDNKLLAINPMLGPSEEMAGHSLANK
jgi:hypothetical protein